MIFYIPYFLISRKIPLLILGGPKKLHKQCKTIDAKIELNLTSNKKLYIPNTKVKIHCPKELFIEYYFLFITFFQRKR